VIVEHGGVSSVASSIARDILLKAQGLKSAQPSILRKGQAGLLSDDEKRSIEYTKLRALKT
jgi:hypothetical protein